ncbi:hypothetical protein [Pseudomonas sp. Marseille-QA0332]
MQERNLELVHSLDMRQTLAKLQDKAPLDFAEYRLLHDCVQARLDRLVRRLGGPAGLQELEALCQAGERMAHRLQVACLALRRLNLSEPDRQTVREALDYQIAYLQACLHRSMAGFERSR